LDQYFSSVRELEQRLHGAEAWEHTPKPVVQGQAPEDIDDAKEFVRRTAMTLEVVRLALETDSTRIVTLFVDTTVIHNITHHGNRPETVTELRAHEEAQFGVLGQFLSGLSAAPEGGQNLLARTMVLYGTPMGSANSHSNTNLPVLLAGGGFKHGQHLGFHKVNNHPLPTLIVSMLQRLGIATDSFAGTTGTMRGLTMTA
jgi:hypothetical protein